MRLDNSISYLMSEIFVIAMLVVGTELLFLANIVLTTGHLAHVELGGIVKDRYGGFMSYFFLAGFFATSFSSVLVLSNGVSLMFADF